MRKRIICLIVAIVMCCSAFAGCNLVTFDQERDNNKVVISAASQRRKTSFSWRSQTLLLVNVLRVIFFSFFIVVRILIAKVSTSFYISKFSSLFFCFYAFFFLLS